MNEQLVITALTYIAAGLLPAVIAVYLIRIRFLGAIWGASLVALVGAFAGAILDATVLTMPHILSIAGTVDIVPPIAGSIILPVLLGLVSRSNTRR